MINPAQAGDRRARAGEATPRSGARSEVTPDTYPQRGNPGTLNEADASRFFEALGQTLQLDEFSVVRVGIEAELARFSAFCPDPPAHLIDRPASRIGNRLWSYRP